MRGMARTALAAAFGMGLALGAGAQTGGMMGGTGMDGAGGGGMLVVADDGSLLVTEMGMASSMGGALTSQRALVDIAPDGSERWRHEFADGYPMMPVTSGDVAVVVLTGDWWMGGSTSGDTGWPWSGMSGDGTTATAQVELVALSVSTGTELWRRQLDAGGMGMAQFAPDGSRLYLTTHTFGSGMMGPGSVRQGDAAGPGTFAGTTVVAIDPATGVTLWTKELSGSSMMGGR